MNRSDRGADDGLVIWISDVGARIARKEEFAGSHNAAVGAPKVIDYWWYDAIMHVARDKEVELGKVIDDFWVLQEDGGVNDGDFRLVFW